MTKVVFDEYSGGTVNLDDLVAFARREILDCILDYGSKLYKPSWE